MSLWVELYQPVSLLSHTRDPTPEPVDAPNDLGEHIWDPYTFENTNYFYISNITVYQDQQYRQRDYAFWDEYMRYVAGDAFPIIMNSVLRECFFFSQETLRLIMTLMK